MKPDSYSVSLFYILHSTYSFIKHKESNPISSAIVTIIHDRENESPLDGIAYFFKFIFPRLWNDNLKHAPQKRKNKGQKANTCSVDLQ